MKRIIRWLRFGSITEHVRAIDCGVPSEIEFTGRFGKVIGYWAYGYYDLNYPYQG